MPGLESGVRPVGRRDRLEGREFRRSVWPEGLDFCLESGVPPGGPRVFFFSVRRAAFCLRVALVAGWLLGAQYGGRVGPRRALGGTAMASPLGGGSVSAFGLRDWLGTRRSADTGDVLMEVVDVVVDCGNVEAVLVGTRVGRTWLTACRGGDFGPASEGEGWPTRLMRVEWRGPRSNSRVS